MITITREWLRDNRACYTDNRIAKLVPANGLTPLQVLDLTIPAADRVWVLTRPGVLTREQVVAFARGCAGRSKEYAAVAADAYAAASASASAYAAANAYAAASYAAVAADAASAAVAAYDAEREKQIVHLRELIGK